MNPFQKILLFTCSLLSFSFSQAVAAQTDSPSEILPTTSSDSLKVRWIIDTLDGYVHIALELENASSSASQVEYALEAIKTGPTGNLSKSKQGGVEQLAAHDITTSGKVNMNYITGDILTVSYIVSRGEGFSEKRDTISKTF